MLQQCACCTMFVHSEARAALCDCIVPQDVTKGVHRQGDVIFNMPPEHAQRCSCPKVPMQYQCIVLTLGVRALSCLHSGPSRAQAISSSQSPGSW